LQQVLEEANELKTHGNDLFREGKWQRALEVYLEGLQVVPSRPSPPKNAKGKARAQDDGEGEGEAAPEAEDSPLADAQASTTSPKEHEAEALPETSPIALMEQQCAVLRSIFNSNIAACYVKLVRSAASTLSPDMIVKLFLLVRTITRAP
jgi:hypothetical protein